MRTSTRFEVGILAVAILAVACAPVGGEPDEDPYGELPSFEDLYGGKADTGYVGTRAAELEATLTSRVRVLLPGRSQEELAGIASGLQANPSSWEYRDVTSRVTDQIRFARNELKAQQLDLNLEGGSPTFERIDVVEGGLDLHFAVRIESLVKFKDLESRGLTPDSLVGRVVEPRLPLVPEGLFERAGSTCATDAETGRPPDELRADNFFYYFDPSREGCVLSAEDLVTARYEIESSLDAPTVYPEYDLLTADGRIDMVAIFGQIEHGELKSSDWGFISFGDFTDDLERMGFRVVESYPDDRGHRMEKEYAGGLRVRVDMYTPVDFADSVAREEANEKFRSAMRGNEIVYYNGHAFYGSLRVLDDPSAYPPGVYQIVFMDACWSYAYYTKQVFRNRATPEDPDGYALADVVNNTEPGITGSEATAAILWENVFKGAATHHTGADSSLYSWNNLVGYMNEHAELRARRRISHPDPEIYGVSGVRTNRFQPGSDTGADPEPNPDARRFESSSPVSVPDDDSAGATSTIGVPSGTGTTGTVRVEVDVEHAFVGDLVVTLEHAGRTAMLHDRTGGSTVDLSLRLDVGDFEGTSADGDWVLHVVDAAPYDEGRIVRWAIEI